MDSSCALVYLVLVCLSFGAQSYAAKSQNSGDPCTTPNGERAACTPVKNCEVIRKVLRRREMENVEFLLASQCDNDAEPLVCCGTKSKFDEVASMPKHLLRTATPSDALADMKTCGRMSYQDRIFGGHSTGLDEFPWMALIVFENENLEKKHFFRCGAALIGRRYVLTAAHCFNNKQFVPTKVRLGEWDLSTEKDCVDLQGYPDCAEPHQDIDIEAIIIHPDFKKYEHDIALIRLAEPARYSDFVAPICLPGPMDAAKVGTNLTVSGWGMTSGGGASQVKMKLNVPKTSRRSCKAMYGRQGIKIIKGHLCAGGINGEDACVGDSGGPLMHYFENNPSQFYIEGVVSFGNSCGVGGWPGVYTRVTRYLQWIYANVV